MRVMEIFVYLIVDRDAVWCGVITWCWLELLPMCSMKRNIMLILLKIGHDCSPLYHNQDDVQGNNDGYPPAYGLYSWPSLPFLPA